MTWWQAIFLSIIQGLTEFLPVSSSAHLVIFQKFFGLEPPVLFDIFVHVGTLIAIVFFFRKELGEILKGLFKKDKNAWKVFWLVFFGTIPAIIVGLILQKNIEKIFDSLKLVGFSLLITGSLLISTKWFKQKNKRGFRSLRWFDGLFIGFFQALAILPGISRSGSTIVGGLLKKLDYKTAFQFSFLLAIPAILGALILQLPDLVDIQFKLLNQAILGMIIAGLVGYFALQILKKFLLNFKLWFFGIYCFFLAIFLLFF